MLLVDASAGTGQPMADCATRWFRNDLSDSNDQYP